MKALQWNTVEIQEPKIACLGFFDGIHPGHLKVINQVMLIKKETKLASLFFTLSESIQDFLNQTNNKILDNKSKYQFSEKVGFDYYLEVSITTEFINLSWFVFLTILKERFNIIKIVVGSDFKFGKNREGDITKIIDFFGKDNVYIINRANDDDYSSTIIRNLLLNHDLKLVNKLLYQDFHIRGIVKHGQQLGRTINFPTANIYLTEHSLLPYGVYVTNSFVKNQFYRSMTSYRQFEGREVVETYLLDANLELYGEEMIVYFKEFIRENVKINNLEELIQLLKKDLDYTLAFYKNKD